MNWSKKMATSQFDELGDEYFNISGGHVHVYYAKKKATIINNYPADDLLVLDVGCGVGEHAKLVKGNCKNICGIDLSLEMVKSANKNVGVFFASQGDATKLPFKDSSFNVVYTSNTLHHIKDLNSIKNTISELARVSKKYIIIFEFNSMNPFCKYLLFRLCPYDRGDERIPTKKEMKSIFEQLGLSDINIIHKSFMPMFCPKFLMPSFCYVEQILEKIMPSISVEMVYIIKLDTDYNEL